MLQTFKQLKTIAKITPKYVRWDDAPENHKAEQLCLENGFNIQFEYTPSGTPQRNGRFERKFATCYGRIWARYKAANIKEEDLKYRV